MGAIRHYFVCANTADGLVNYFPQALKDMKRVYILKGGPGTGKSTMMKKIGNHFAKRGEAVEHIHCSSDPDSLDGVILRDRRVAVADGTAPHVIEPTAPGAVEEYVNLGAAWDAERLSGFRREILDFSGYIAEQYHRLYEALRLAKEAHTRLESLLSKDNDSARESAESLLQLLFTDIPVRENDGVRHHRFFGALTPEGVVHFWDNLSGDCRARYFLHGNSDLQKSELLLRIAEEACRRGLEAELYHCNLNADRLDMVRIPQIGACIADADAPHECFPERETDCVLDLNQDRQHTESEQGEIISLLRREYEENRNRAKALLYAAHTAHDALEKIYHPAIDFSVVNGLCSLLIKEIERI